MVFANPQQAHRGKYVLRRKDRTVAGARLPITSIRAFTYVLRLQ